MRKLNKRKGYSLLEVIFSLAIFLSLSSLTFSMEMRNLNIIKENRDMNRYLQFFEGLKNTLLYNYDYRDMEEIILKMNPDFKKSCNLKLYVNSENLTLERLKNNNLEEIVSQEKFNSLPNLEILIEENTDGVMKISLNLNIESSNEHKRLNTYFYKGDY